jgi:dethiobiotin synthetase
VTGTDTGVGKTRVALGLCQAFAMRGNRVAAMKPVASGCSLTPAGLRNDDALALQGAMNVQATYSEVNPYAFAPPIAPHIAAAEAGVTIDFDVLDHAFEQLSSRSDVVVVEGAGGWLVPLDERRTLADLAVAWQLKVVLVVGMRLGCLNHAQLTAESVQRRGLILQGWVANAMDPHFDRLDENIASLRTRMPAPCLGVLEYAPLANSQTVALGLLPGLISAIPI